MALIASRSIGNAGLMEIHDDGSLIVMRVRSGDPATFHNNLPYRVYVDGTWHAWSTITYPSGSPWVTVWADYRSASQSVAFQIGDTGTWGLGAGGDLWGWISRATVPPAPTPLGVDEITPTSARYRFNGNGNGGSSITAWHAQIASDAAFTTDVQLVTSGGTTTFTDLTPGTTYYFRSRGVNALGEGPWSSVISALVALPAPTLTGWTQTPTGGLVATWTPPAVTTGLIGYRLQVARDDAFTIDVQNITLGDVLTRTVTGLAGARRYYARVAARTAGGVNTYSSTRNVMLVLDAGNLDGWTRVTDVTNLVHYTAEGARRGTAGGKQAIIVEALTTDATTAAPLGSGILRTISGLTIGKAYKFEATGQLIGPAAATDYRVSVAGEGTGDPVTLTTTPTLIPGHEFIADTTEVIVMILMNNTLTMDADEMFENVAFTSIRLLEMATDYPVRLRETVYESNLANHFDLACNSVGASWHVGRDGQTRFLLPGAALPLSAVFTDEVNDNALHYVDIAAAYDTRGMVNRLEVTNYGVDEDRENEQNETLIVTDDDSIDRYGVRSADLDTNLWDQPPYDESLNDRLQQLLDGRSEPDLFISGLRWNAQEDLTAAAQLEIGQRVHVRFNGVVQDSQIVNLHHDMTPTRWMITLGLQRIH